MSVGSGRIILPQKKGKGILTPLQKEFLSSLPELQDIDYFYLTGGTALAEFYLGHRRSYDLDFFTREKDLTQPFSRIMEEKLRGSFQLTTIRRFRSFVEIEIGKEDERIRVHLAYDTPYRFADPELSEYGIHVNDYQDLIADKLLTFFGRWEPRDAVDLFFILQKEEVEKLMDMAKKKDPGFDRYWFCVALQEVESFPDDIGRWPIDPILNIDVIRLKQKFHELARRIMEKIK